MNKLKNLHIIEFFTRDWFNYIIMLITIFYLLYKIILDNTYIIIFKDLKVKSIL